MHSPDDAGGLRRQIPGEEGRPIRLGGSTLGTRAHICAFFNHLDDD
jgi:hypothetical protein